MRKFSLASIGLCAVMFLAEGGVAHADRRHIDTGKIEALVAQIEAALEQLGPNATAQQDMAAIQSIIAASGASPREAEAALQVVASSGLGQSASVAVASVDQEIELALAGAPPQAGGGPGGSAALGGPPAYVSGGGSNYSFRP
jgi:hypothetical protein